MFDKDQIVAVADQKMNRLVGLDMQTFHRGSSDGDQVAINTVPNQQDAGRQ